MTVSDKILPIRFYDSLYDQSRFSSLCHETCQFNLVYPASKLPHFQLKRDAIFAAPSMFYLRNICTDQEYNNYVEIPEGADNFCNTVACNSWWGGMPKKEIIGYDMDDNPIYGPNDILVNDCCKLKNVLNNTWVIPDLACTFTSASTLKRKIRICVDKIVNNSGLFQIKVYNDTILCYSITTAGIHEFEYTDNGTADFHLVFFNYSGASGDYFEISEIQAWTDYFTDAFPLTNDVELDETDLNVINLKDGTDIIIYCNAASYTSNIPDGEYYYVIKSGSDVYFSEVFKIVSLKTIENLYKLKWNHDCDFNDSVLYSSDTINCTFENILYLDANLIKPEYDTAEDVDTNGEGDQTVKFKRWQKNITLEIGKSPKFLTDSLSAIFLHKNISILEHLNITQDVQNNLHEVLKITNDISDIIYECYQSVKLKLLLEDKITDTACCNLANVIKCDPCGYNAGINQEDCGGGSFITIVDGNGSWWTNPCSVPRYSYTLRDCDGNTINVKETDIICYEGTYITLKWYEGLDCNGDQVGFYYKYTEAPTIDSIAFSWVGIYIYGYLLPNTFGKAYIQPGCSGDWYLIDTFAAGDDGSYTFLYTVSALQPYIGENTCWCFKVQNVSMNCDFGYTNTETYGTC